MERGSTKHGRLVDEALEEDLRPLVQGPPTELGGTDNDTAEPLVAEDGSELGLASAEFEAPSPGALSPQEVRDRSELGRHLRPSIFPAGPVLLLATAVEEGAPDWVLDQLGALPAEAEYATVQEVWETLGGHKERDQHDPEFEFPQEHAAPTEARFGFVHDETMSRWSAMFGVDAESSEVVVTTTEFDVRFGPWSISTSRENVAGAEATGPYKWWKVAGPPHLSLADRGVTFATTAAGGVCIRFRDPVKVSRYVPLLSHPALTVTVEDAEGLLAVLDP